MHSMLFIDVLVNNRLRIYLRSRGILNIFVKQLQFKGTALLAAYALTKCLAHRLSISC